jgi:hypothetical protein
LLALLTLIAYLPPTVMFSLLTISLLMTTLIFDLSQLYFYRRGL